MQAEVEGIRDRVTISSWGEARTSRRYETYDRFGNLYPITASPEPMEPVAAAQATRCEVTFVLVPYPVPVMRHSDPEPVRTLAWSPLNALPESV